ncbi:multiheme c-type cytochrome [Coraliomargarita parva]|uniref:multiheme c-type cytochrome n=1 Tax=Coraliomargarita parva TaxID=3014050 RepID=UPI0022B303EC|nr:multiheme c-type cytochrome [Coraliomargarita parva]
MRSKSPFQIARILALLCLLLLAFVSGCGRGDQAKLARIVLTADIRGRLVPCGCFTGQLGGMTRLHTRIGSNKKQNELRLDVGDAIRGTEDYHQMEYAHILEAFQLMQFDALNLGGREAQLSAEVLKELHDRTDAPLISANLIDTESDSPLLPVYRVSDLSGTKVIITGIIDPASMHGQSSGSGLRVEDPDQILRELLPKLRKDCDLLILLAFANENRLRHYAEEYYEADFILGGDVSQPSGNTRHINQSQVFYVANESRTIGLIDFSTQRIPERQRADIKVLNAQPELLYEDIPESLQIRSLANNYRDLVRTAELDIDDPGKLDADRIPGVRQAAEYVGTENCIACHQEDYSVWRKSGHAKAWETLVHNNADADPNCIRCHTVGFGTESGYRRAYRHEKLVSVGCESCHGPGSRHVEERSKNLPVTFHFRPLAEADCRSCHYGEFSRPFEWDLFWPDIAHGRQADRLSLTAVTDERKQ